MIGRITTLLVAGSISLAAVGAGPVAESSLGEGSGFRLSPDMVSIAYEEIMRMYDDSHVGQVAAPTESLMELRNRFVNSGGVYTLIGLRVGRMLDRLAVYKTMEALDSGHYEEVAGVTDLLSRNTFDEQLTLERAMVGASLLPRKAHQFGLKAADFLQSGAAGLLLTDAEAYQRHSDVVNDVLLMKLSRENLDDYIFVETLVAINEARLVRSLIAAIGQNEDYYRREIRSPSNIFDKESPLLKIMRNKGESRVDTGEVPESDMRNVNGWMRSFRLLDESAGLGEFLEKDRRGELYKQFVPFIQPEESTSPRLKPAFAHVKRLIGRERDESIYLLATNPEADKIAGPEAVDGGSSVLD